MAKVNVLGFSECGLASCDCGARIVFGVSRANAKAMVAALTKAGFALEAVTLGDLTAEAEPLTSTARQDLLRYVE